MPEPALFPTPPCAAPYAARKPPPWSCANSPPPPRARQPPFQTAPTSPPRQTSWLTPAVLPRVPFQTPAEPPAADQLNFVPPDSAPCCAAWSPSPALGLLVIQLPVLRKESPS